MDETPVSDLMTTPVLTIARDTAIAEAADAMLQSEIKSIVVIDEDCTAQGILTSTDILQVAADEQPPTGTTVADYMTTDVETVSEDTPVPAAAAQMVELGINHIPVVDADEAVSGILTSTDITSELSGE